MIGFPTGCSATVFGNLDRLWAQPRVAFRALVGLSVLRILGFVVSSSAPSPDTLCPQFSHRAVCGAMLYARTIAPPRNRLVMGIPVSILGLYFSVLFDLPTGATIVCTFGVVLAAMALVRPLIYRAWPALG